MSRTILAAALALLAFTVPAHAGFLVDESVDLVIKPSESWT